MVQTCSHSALALAASVGCSAAMDSALFLRTIAKLPGCKKHLSHGSPAWPAMATCRSLLNQGRVE
jgi:hypothetical protein